MSQIGLITNLSNVFVDFIWKWDSQLWDMITNKINSRGKKCPAQSAEAKPIASKINKNTWLQTLR